MMVSAEAQEFPYGMPAVFTSVQPFVQLAPQAQTGDALYLLSCALDALHWEYQASEWYQTAISHQQAGYWTLVPGALVQTAWCWGRAGYEWQYVLDRGAAYPQCGIDVSSLAPVFAAALAQAQQMRMEVRAQIARYCAQYGIPLPAEPQEEA